MQKATFRMANDGLLQSERPPFATPLRACVDYKRRPAAL